MFLLLKIFQKTVIDNDMRKSSRNFNNSMRFVQWHVPPGDFAPKYLKLEDMQEFNNFTVHNATSAYMEPKYLFARKVSIDYQKDVVEWIKENHLNI